MKAFIRRNWLTIGLAVLPVLIWYYWERKEAGLGVVLAADIPVVAVQQQWSKDISIQYRSEPVSSVRALEISVTNTGNQAIRANDWESPLVVALPVNTRIIAVPIVTVRRPKQLAPKMTVSGSEITLDPLLLNGGDSFTFRVLLADWTRAEVPVAVRGRVTDVQEVRFSNQSRTPADAAKESDGPWWGFPVFFGGLVAIGILIVTLDRLRLPARMHALASARRALELTPAQRKMAAATLQSAGRPDEGPDRRVREIRSRLELQLRAIAARDRYSLELSRTSPSELLERILRAGIVDKPLGTVLGSFFQVSESLLTWSWKNTEDYEIVAATGADALAALSSIPSLLQQEADPVSESERAPTSVSQ